MVPCYPRSAPGLRVYKETSYGSKAGSMASETRSGVGVRTIITSFPDCRHHLQQVEQPDHILIHPVERGARCQHDLRAQAADVPERRQVMDLPPKRLWVTQHRVEEKQCPRCFHLTRANFPASVKAPAQYGTSIQTLATYLVEGQVVPYARASQLLQDLLGVQLSAGSIASFVTTCHQQLAEVESSLKAALVKTNVIHQDETGLRVGTMGWWVHVCSTERP